MSKANELLEVLDELDWDNYVAVADAATKFSMVEIETELARQASIYSYYQGMLSLAKKNLDAAKLELTRFCATERKREKGNRAGTKITAKDLDDLVESSDGFFAYNKAQNDCEFKYTLLKGLTSALEQKKDMLVQLSSNRRAETNLYK